MDAGAILEGHLEVTVFERCAVPGDLPPQSQDRCQVNGILSENGRITPSADAVVRLAETFDVSTGSLLAEAAPRAAGGIS